MSDFFSYFSSLTLLISPCLVGLLVLCSSFVGPLLVLCSRSLASALSRLIFSLFIWTENGFHALEEGKRWRKTKDVKKCDLFPRWTTVAKGWVVSWGMWLFVVSILYACTLLYIFICRSAGSTVMSVGYWLCRFNQIRLWRRSGYKSYLHIAVNTSIINKRIFQLFEYKIKCNIYIILKIGLP